MIERRDEPKPLRLAVGIATVGRPQILRETLTEIQRQVRRPDRIIVSHCSDKDVIGVHSDRNQIELIRAPLGLTRQRNAIIRFVENYDILVFFDDDFFPAPPYLKVVEEAFQSNLNYQIVTGRVLADGVRGKGIEPMTARSLIESDPGSSDPLNAKEVYNGYGCNMSIRMASVLKQKILFDEDLPLYGWLEDVDFSRRLASQGKIVKLDGARGIHLGTKSGRTTGRRLGYSQIANPLYMSRRGTLSRPRALKQIVQNMTANALRAVWPESNIDRKGRLQGNIQAIVDLLKNRCHPMRILEFR